VKYLTAILVAWTATSFVPVADEEFRTADGILLVLIVLVTVFGLWAAYRANGGQQGTDLAGRFLAIGWVVGIRLMALMLTLLAFAFVLVMVLAFREQELSDRSIEMGGWVTALLAEMLFYWRLTHHLASVRGAA
jgi:hypothetical protein